MAFNYDVNVNYKANTTQAISEIQKLESSLNKVLNTTASGNFNKNLTQSFKDASLAALELQKHLQIAVNTDTGVLNISKLNASFKQAGVTLEDYRRRLSSIGPEGQAAFQNLSNSILKAQVPMREASTLMTKFSKTLANTARWQLSSSLLHGFIRGIRQSFNYVKELNENLNKIQIVTGQSTEKMEQFAIQANKAAQSLSTTTNEYVKASLIYYQQGLNDKAVQERTDVTMKMANVTGKSAEEISSEMTAIWNNFDQGSHSLEYFSDVITNLGAKTASSSAEIAQGLEKFAATSRTIGLSYEYATSALATVTAQTRQSADTVGTAFKTMFARIQGLELGDTLEDGTNLTKYSKALKKVGVDIKDQQGQLKNMDIILDEIGNKWETLSKDQRTALAETIAGVRQYTQFVALFDNWSKFKENLNTAESSEGTLNKQQKAYEQSWQAASDRVKASIEEIYSKIIDDQFFIKLTDGIAKFVKIISNVIDGLGGVKGLLLGISSLVLTVYGKDIARNLNNFFTTQKQRIQEWRATQEAAINSAKQDSLRQQSVINKISGETGTSAYNSVSAQVYEDLRKKSEELVTNEKNLTDLEKEQLQNEIELLKLESDKAKSLEKQYETALNILRTKQQEHEENKKMAQDNKNQVEKEVEKENKKAQSQVNKAEKNLEDRRIALEQAQSNKLKAVGEEKSVIPGKNLVSTLNINKRNLEDMVTRDLAQQKVSTTITNAVSAYQKASTNSASQAAANRIYKAYGEDSERAEQIIAKLDKIKAIEEELAPLTDNIEQAEQRKLEAEKAVSQATENVTKVQEEGANKVKAAEEERQKTEERSAEAIEEAKQKVEEFQQALNNIRNLSFSNKELIDAGRNRAINTFKQSFGTTLSRTANLSGDNNKNIRNELHQQFTQNIKTEGLESAQAILQKSLEDLGVDSEQAAKAVDNITEAYKSQQEGLDTLSEFLGISKEQLEAFREDQTIPQESKEKFEELFNVIKTGEGNISEATQKLQQLFNNPNQPPTEPGTPVNNKPQGFLGIPYDPKANGGDTLVKTARGLSQVAMGIQAIQNLGSIWENEDTSLGEKVLSTLTGIGMAIPMVLNGFSQLKSGLSQIPSLATKAVASIKGVETSAVSATAAMGYFALIIAAIAAAIAAVVITFKAADAAFNKNKYAAEEATKAYEGLKEQYDALKSTNEELKNSLEEYNDSKKALDDMVTGTDEWKTAVQDLNAKVLELIGNYSGLSQYVYTDKNGVLTLNQQGQAELLKKQQQAEQDMLQATTLQQSEKTMANVRSEIEGAAHKVHYIDDKGQALDTTAQIYENLVMGPLGQAVYQMARQSNSTYGYVSNQTTEEQLEKILIEINKFGPQVLNQTAELGKIAGISEEQVNAIKEQYGEDKLITLASKLDAANKESLLEQQTAGASMVEEMGLADSEYADQLANVIGTQAAKIAKEETNEAWEDGGFWGGGPDDEEVQRKYAELMGYEWVSDEDGNKGKYRINGEEQEINDEVARAALAKVEAEEKAKEKTQEYIEVIKQVEEATGSTNKSVLNILMGLETSLDNINKEEMEAIKNFDLSSLGLDEEIIEELGLDEEKIKKVSEKVESQWNQAQNDIYSGLLNEAKGIYRNLNKEVLDKMNLDSQKATTESLNKAVAMKSQQAIQFIQSAFDQLDTEQAEDFVTVLNGIDWQTTSIEDFRKSFSDMGIQIKENDSAITSLISSMKKHVDALTELQEKYKTLDSILSELKNGKTISPEDYASLSDSSKQYFAMMLDGTYKLMISAEEFQKRVTTELRNESIARINELEKRKEIAEKYQNIELNAIDTENLTKGKTITNDYGQSYAKLEIDNSINDDTAKNRFKEKNIENITKSLDLVTDVFTQSTESIAEELDYKNKGVSLKQNLISKIKDKVKYNEENGANFTQAITSIIQPDQLSKIPNITDIKTREELYDAIADSVITSYENIETSIEKEKNAYTDEGQVKEIIDTVKNQRAKIESLNLDEDQQAEYEDLLKYFVNGVKAIPIDIVDRYNKFIESVDEKVVDELNQELYKAELSLALSAKNLDELQEMKASGQLSNEDYTWKYKDENGEIQEVTGNAYNTAANQLYEEQNTAGLDPDEIREYAKYTQNAAEASDMLADSLKEDDDAAKDVAASIMRMNKGVESLSSNWETWGDVLKKSDASAQETAKAMSGIKQVISDFTGVSMDFLDGIDQNWINEHAEDFKKAAKGDAEAIDSLREAAREPVIQEIQMNLENSEYDLEAKTNELLKDFKSDFNIEIGAKLSDDALTELNKIVDESEMTADQAQAYLNSIGFDAQIETEEIPMPQEVPIHAVYRDYEAEPKAEELINGGYKLAYKEVIAQEGTQKIPAEVNGFAMAVGKKPKIKKANKRASGAANNSSSINAGGKDKSKSSGNKGSSSNKSTKPTKDPYFRVEAQNKRLTHLYNQLEKAVSAVDKVSEHLYGKAKISMMQKKIQLLKDEVATNQALIENLKTREKIDIQQLNKQRNKLGKYKVDINTGEYKRDKNGKKIKNKNSLGLVDFDEVGNITNYDEIYDAYNAQRKKYKKAGKSDEFIEKFDTKWQKTLDKIEEYQNRMDTLDSTREQITDAQLNDIDLYYQMLENIQNINEYELELKLNITEAKKQAKNFKKYINSTLDLDTIQIHIDPKNAQLAFMKAFKDTNIDLYEGFNNFEATQENINNRINGEKGLAALKAAIDDGIWSDDEKTLFGFDNLSEAMAKFNENAKDYFADVENAQSSLEESWNAYLETLDQITEQTENLNSELEKMTKILDYEKQMIELIYGDKAYTKMQEYYKASLTVSKQQLNVHKEAAKLGKEEFLNAANAAKEQGLDVDINDLTQSNWTVDMKKWYETWQNGYLSSLDDITQISQTYWDQYTSYVQESTDKMEKAMWGVATEDMETNWDRAQEKASMFLDNVQKTYKIQDLVAKMDKEINNSKNLQNQQKLQKLREQELKDLRAKQKITQTDLDLAEARFELTLKEIALRDAENNKNSMKLVRDANGDWTYQYVANMDNINEKQQDYNSALNDYYEKSKEGYENMLGNIKDLGTRMIEEINAVWLSNLSPEQKQQKIQEITDFYNEMIEETSRLAEEYGGENAVAGGSILLNAIGLDPDAMKGYTEQEQDLFNKMKQANIEDLNDLRNKIIGEDGQGGAYGELHDALDKHFISNNKLTQTYVGQNLDMFVREGGLLPTIQTSIQDVDQKYQDCISNIEFYSDIGKEAIKQLSNNESTGAYDVVYSTLSKVQIATDNLFSETTTNKIATQRDVIKEMSGYWSNIATQAAAYAKTVEDYNLDLNKNGKNGSGEGKTAADQILKTLSKDGNISEKLKKINFKASTTNKRLEGIKEAISNIKITVKTSSSGSSGGSGGSGGNSGGSSGGSGKGATKVDAATTKRKAQEVAGYLLKTYNPSNGIDENLSRIFEGDVFKNIFKKSSMSQSAIQDYIINYMLSLESAYKIHRNDSGIIKDPSRLEDVQKALKIENVKTLKDIAALETGGYTGNWDDNSGKLAFLHKKELVLNAKDTENMLEAVKLTHQLVNSAIGNNISLDIFTTMQATQEMLSNSVEAFNKMFGNMIEREQSLGNQFYITAEFPNANDVTTIREAILSLPNMANQYVNKK